MPFSDYPREKLIQHLKSLDIRCGAKVVIHSSLLAFGRIVGQAVTVLDALRECVGPEGLICVPTFTFGLDPEKPFDVQSQPPIGMGALANYIWRLAEARRTPSCIHSYAAVGSGAEILGTVANNCSFGKGSFFELAELEDFRWVMLGCQISEGCTLLHNVEVETGVPYRTLKALPRKIVHADGTIEKIIYNYHARNCTRFACDFKPVRDSMLKDGSMIRIEAPYGESLAASTAAIARCGRHLLQSNPYALVKEVN